MDKFFQKIIFMLIVFFVFAGIVGGLLMTGGPTQQRKVLYDSKKAEAIDKLSLKIGYFYEEHDKLPKNLFELINVSADYYKDPVTKNLPDYRKVSDNKYKLCMTFITSNISEKKDKKNYTNYDYYYRKFKHPSGYHCVEYQKKPDSSYFYSEDEQTAKK